jgi:hypothetical protein
VAKVDIVKVKNPANVDPGVHHAVEQELTEKLLFECDTQREAISWATKNGYEINIHRERNRKPTDRHGRFRQQ